MKTVAHRFCRYQMSIVNGVKGTAHDGNTFAVSEISDFVSHDFSSLCLLISSQEEVQ